jgi:hypothetical protein
MQLKKEAGYENFDGAHKKNQGCVRRSKVYATTDL